MNYFNELQTYNYNRKLQSPFHHSYQHTESNIKLNALHIIGPVPSLELNLTNEDIKAVILARFKEKSKGLFVLVIRL